MVQRPAGLASAGASGSGGAVGDTLTLVVMGVSGVGKSTIAGGLAEATGWPFAEGDDLHPESNRTKMAGGHPLDDTDRWPWLRRIAAWIGEQEVAGRSAVVTCSALRRAYRDLLRDGHPSVYFVHLLAEQELLARRMSTRPGHFMPSSLLASQLDTLEPLEPDEPGTAVAATADAATIVATVLGTLGDPQKREG